MSAETLDSLSSDGVSALVREMQSASSVNDAEHRATNVLRAFEESTLEQAEIEIKRIRKQNELLKRAVTIQNARLKQSGDAQTLKRQVAELQSMCQSYEEQLATAQRNNYSLGVQEQIIFPEIDYDQIDSLRGLDITITTTARTDDEGRALLRAFNFPLKE